MYVRLRFDLQIDPKTLLRLVLAPAALLAGLSLGKQRLYSGGGSGRNRSASLL